MSRPVNRFKKVGLWSGFTSSMIAALCFSGIISSAMASDSTYLSGEITTNEVYRFYKARSWGSPYFAYQTPYAGTQGGTLTIGLRDEQEYQFARAEATHGKEAQFVTPYGTKLRPRDFHIKTRSL